MSVVAIERKEQECFFLASKHDKPEASQEACQVEGVKNILGKEMNLNLTLWEKAKEENRTICFDLASLSKVQENQRNERNDYSKPERVSCSQCHSR